MDSATEQQERDRARLEAEGWELTSQSTFPAFGSLWYRREGDDHCFAFTVEPRYLNRFGIVHGGVIATLADCALGRAGRHGSHDHVQSTIDLDVHFIGAGVAGDFIVARARLRRETRSLAFASGTIQAGDKLIADIGAIFKIHRRIQHDDTG